MLDSAQRSTPTVPPGPADGLPQTAAGSSIPPPVQVARGGRRKGTHSRKFQRAQPSPAEQQRRTAAVLRFADYMAETRRIIERLDNGAPAR